MIPLVLNLLSQTNSTTMFVFDYFYVNAQVLSKLFHPIKYSFSQASNYLYFVLTICLKLAKKERMLLMKGDKKIEMHVNTCIQVFNMWHAFWHRFNGFLLKLFLKKYR